MLKKSVIVLLLISSHAFGDGSQAVAVCYNLSGNSGQLLNTEVNGQNCSQVWNELYTSGQFPDIFNAGNPKLYQGLCYVSTGAIPAMIGNTAVTVNTASAWTTYFAPALFNLGTDNLGSVITQWSVSTLQNGKAITIGNVFTRDTVDTSSNSEQDIIISGSGQFYGATGAVRLESQPVFNPQTSQPTGYLQILKISGELCLPGAIHHSGNADIE